MNQLWEVRSCDCARLAARTAPDGSPVLLGWDQDRRRWDRLLINRGLGRAPGGRGPGAGDTAPKHGP